MGSVVLKDSRYHPEYKSFWRDTEDCLFHFKIEVLRGPIDADMSIVLSGLFENPAMPKGKKVLAFKSQEWISCASPPQGWKFYESLLQHYYDDFIDLSSLDPKQSAQRIINYMKEDAK